MLVAAGATTASALVRAVRRTAVPTWTTLLLGLTFVISFLT